MHPRFRPWTNVRFLNRIPSPWPYLPSEIRRVSQGPVFGRELYALLSRAKIVFNASIDMAGSHRGNIRCFEAMGCGACMVSDEGIYPDGMVDGETFVSYNDSLHAVAALERLLAEPERARTIGRRAAAMLAERHSKEQQWQRFGELVHIAQSVSMRR
jgi:spore maturation protein CgeB